MVFRTCWRLDRVKIEDVRRFQIITSLDKNSLMLFPYLMENIIIHLRHVFISFGCIFAPRTQVVVYRQSNIKTAVVFEILSLQAQDATSRFY